MKNASSITTAFQQALYAVSGEPDIRSPRLEYMLGYLYSTLEEIVDTSPEASDIVQGRIELINEALATKMSPFLFMRGAQ